jgi:hypothetical protein
MPGFTHLQVAQPVTWGHHMLAYVEMLARDIGRFSDARARMNECPLGAAALAGTGFPIDREMTAKALGFDRPMANSLDAVSDRDFALEFLSAAAICAVHLSRLAEELVIWSSAQFRFVTLSDRFSTGSSIMPQKKNPDAAELIRAKIGRILGAAVALFTVMKGLPLAYSKDMQEDKEQVFDAADTLMLALAAMEGMVRDMRNRFLVSFILAIPVFLYSPLFTQVFKIQLPQPFGLSNELISFLLATPAVLYGGWVFYIGAWRGLKNRTLNMAVLVTLSVLAGYLFSVAATFLFHGEVFYEAAVLLLTFVLFGHWMEMRARSGA